MTTKTRLTALALAATTFITASLPASTASAVQGGNQANQRGFGIKVNDQETVGN
jgi:hypothetical protein